MRFDVVIIGGGLAGLTAGIRLQQSGKSCALVHGGQSALHFSSGSLDFLNALPDGSPVDKPESAIETLVSQLPEHPYALLGAQKSLELARVAEGMLRDIVSPLTGSLAEGNHNRMTPLGGFCRTWLSSPDVLTANNGESLPWKKVLLVNIEGFLDFYPEIMAEGLQKVGVESRRMETTLPALEVLRKNPSEFRSVNIARVLDLPEHLADLAEKIATRAEGCDAVLLPACLGYSSQAPLQKLENIVGKTVRLIPTLPPSLVGARLSHALIARFLAKGGVHMPGDKAVGYTLTDGRVSKLYTANHEDIALEADDYILATGSFFSQGLKADQNGIRETVFNLDLAAVPEDRDKWTAPSVFASQPYARFGVLADKAMRASIGGKTISNLYAAGMVLGNYDAVQLGCGAGVALTTALAAAEHILNGRSAT